jgi:hypothetical protein
MPPWPHQLTPLEDHDVRLIVNQTSRDQESFFGTYVQQKH